MISHHITAHTGPLQDLPHDIEGAPCGVIAKLALGAGATAHQRAASAE
jgi:hypothetical protein